MPNTQAKSPPSPLFQRGGLKSILFDWSGTLFDDFRVSFISTRATILHFGGPAISLKEYREHFTLPVWKFYRRYIKKIPIDAIDRFYFDHFTAHAPRGRLFPGAKKILQDARAKGIRLFVFSTVRQSILEKICRREKITRYFDAVIGNIRDKESALKYFLRSHRINPRKTLFIGDTDHDIVASRKNGLNAGAMLCGYQPPHRLLECAPDFVWNNHAGFLKFLNTRGGQRGDKRAGGGRGVTATVGALIFNRGDIFLIQTHKWSHTFGIPGGKIKKGETMEDALRREIREETGMEIKNIRFALAQDSINSKEFYRPNQHFLLLNFYAESTSRKFKLNDEAEAGIWVSPKLAMKLKLNQPTLKLLSSLNPPYTPGGRNPAYILGSESFPSNSSKN
ncbi:MAG: HAD hydrolase-like protein [Deltaproteobacteria bacterium]|nr:HAD hydrolase-like protein [Deltaproteobacteria bacterium]